MMDKSWDTSALYTSGVISVIPEPGVWACLLCIAAASLHRRRTRIRRRMRRAALY